MNYEKIKTIMNHTTFDSEEDYLDYLYHLAGHDNGESSIVWIKGIQTYLVKSETKNAWKKRDLSEVNVNIQDRTDTLKEFLMPEDGSYVRAVFPVYETVQGFYNALLASKHH